MPHRLVPGGAALVISVLIGSGVAVAQNPPAAQAAPAAPATTTTSALGMGDVPTYVKPETPEQHAKRVGPVDPGSNPDEKTVFYRNSRAYHISKFERKWAAFDQPLGYVRPFAYTPFIYEIYQLNKDWVWVWVEEPGQEQPEAAESADAVKAPPVKMYGRYTGDQISYLNMIKPEFSALDVPDANVTIRFREASDGLPKIGSWRNTLTVADMNGDGFPDIIAPPERGAANQLPSVFLGDGKGHWRPWNESVWPFGLDYGSVVAADFNKDGHMDLAFGVHLNGIRVFLGDGKGHFTDSSEGLPWGQWGTRRIVVGDFDHDGNPDIAAISEGPRPNSTGPTAGNIRIFLNRDHGRKWEAMDVASMAQAVAGDYLAVGNFNGDRVPDFASGNLFFGGTQSVFLSDANKLKWTPIPSWTPDRGDRVFMPSNSYYFAVAAGHFSSKKLDDAMLSYVRFYPDDAVAYTGKPAVSPVIGIDRISFSGSKTKRVPVIRFAGDRPISGMAVGDFNGDGKADIIFTRYLPRRECVILLGDGKGGFKRADIEGLTLEPLTNYDITVADVNGDGRPDVIIGYEVGQTGGAIQPGSIRVFLNEGTHAGKPAPAGSSAVKPATAQPGATKP